MQLRADDRRTQPAPAGNTDPYSPWLKASFAYDNVINALHETARTLEALGETEHALAFRKDADHVDQRAQRHLRALARGIEAHNDR